MPTSANMTFFISLDRSHTFSLPDPLRSASKSGREADSAFSSSFSNSAVFAYSAARKPACLPKTTSQAMNLYRVYWLHVQRHTHIRPPRTDQGTRCSYRQSQLHQIYLWEYRPSRNALSVGSASTKSQGQLPDTRDRNPQCRESLSEPCHQLSAGGNRLGLYVHPMQQIYSPSQDEYPIDKVLAANAAPRADVLSRRHECNGQ